MAEVDGVRTFRAPADAYDAFMGRYSRELAPPFADFCGVASGQRVLDVGCGPGAFTAVVVQRVGLESVCAIDPTPHFVAATGARHPGLDVRQAAAEDIPYADGAFDTAASQLVLHFVSDPERAVREMARVVGPGGLVAASVWDFAEGMQMLRAFWDASVSLWPDAPDELRTMRFGGEGEIADLFSALGLVDVVETALTVTSSYEDFDELWSTFLGGIGPAGAYLLTRSPGDQEALRAALYHRLGRPDGALALRAVARAVRARVPA